jgi:hypothetical protein
VAASTVANIFAQANNINTSTITAPEINQILAYPNLILYPYDGSSAAVVVSQLLVTVNPNGTATGTVQVSCANANGTVRPKNQQLSVDPSIAAAFSGSTGNYVVLGELSVPGHRNLVLGRRHHLARLNHHDPASREPDHRADYAPVYFVIRGHHGAALVRQQHVSRAGV